MHKFTRIFRKLKYTMSNLEIFIKKLDVHNECPINIHLEK